MNRLRIGLPSSRFLRSFFISFAHLVDSQKADMRLLEDSILLTTDHIDVRRVLTDAYKFAHELLGEYVQRGKTKRELPYSGNDSRWILPKLYRQFGIRRDQPVSRILEAYEKTVTGMAARTLQDSLYPFTGKGELAPLSVFNLEFYGLTRSPYFDGRYEREVKLNCHQTMMCLAGYFAARTYRSRIGDKFVSVLAFPLSLDITGTDFYRILRKNTPELPGIKPEEGVVLWLAIHLRDFPDVLIVAVEDPGGQAPTSVSATIPVCLSGFKSKASEFLDMIVDDGMQRAAMGLIRKSFSKGRRAEADVDDAIEYVKLLYLAAQGFEREQLELLLRSSRVEAQTSFLSDEANKRRHSTAAQARYMAMRLIKMT